MSSYSSLGCLRSQTREDRKTSVIQVKRLGGGSSRSNDKVARCAALGVPPRFELLQIIAQKVGLLMKCECLKPSMTDAVLIKHTPATFVSYSTRVSLYLKDDPDAMGFEMLHWVQIVKCY